MNKLLISLIILAMILAILLPACSSSTEDDTQAFCNSLQELATAEANIRSIDLDTSVDQAKQYAQDLQTAWTNVINAGENLTISKLNDLENAYNSLKSSLDGLSGSQTITQALPAITAALSTFQADLDDIRTTVCTFTPTSTSSP